MCLSNSVITDAAYDRPSKSLEILQTFENRGDVRGFGRALTRARTEVLDLLKKFLKQLI